MNEIICPNCSKAFKVDESGFADILKQVRNHQFEEELQNRLNLAEIAKESAVKLAEANVRHALQEQLAKQENELTKLKAKIDNIFYIYLQILIFKKPKRYLIPLCNSFLNLTKKR